MFCSILFAALGPPCAKKVRKEDPFEIFVFDLTSSSDDESCYVQSNNLTLPKAVSEHPVKRYGTRSKNLQHISRKTFAESDKITTQQRKSKKSVTVTTDPSDLHIKAISTSNFKESSVTDEKTCGYRKTAASTNTPNRPIKPSLEKGIPRSKMAQNVFQVSSYRIASHLTITLLLCKLSFGPNPIHFAQLLVHLLVHSLQGRI